MDVAERDAPPKGGVGDRHPLPPFIAFHYSGQTNRKLNEQRA